MCMVWPQARGRGKGKGKELFFRYCPYCNGDGHDRDTFSVNLENGTFHCFRSSCGKSGHFVEMARDFGYTLDFGEPAAVHTAGFRSALSPYGNPL